MDVSLGADQGSGHVICTSITQEVASGVDQRAVKCELGGLEGAG